MSEVYAAKIRVALYVIALNQAGGYGGILGEADIGRGRPCRGGHWYTYYMNRPMKCIRDVVKVDIGIHVQTC
jgi:hypothetical protein